MNPSDLLVPLSTTWDWQLRAACREMDVSAFYHSDNERGASRRKRTAAAKRVCESCPVILDCLQWALDIDEPHGIWGGKTTVERNLMRADRKRRRP